MKTEICDGCKYEYLTIEEWEDMLEEKGEDYSPCATCNKNYFTVTYTHRSTSDYCPGTYIKNVSRLTEAGVKQALHEIDWSTASDVKITFTHNLDREETDVTKDFKNLIKEVK